MIFLPAGIASNMAVLWKPTTVSALTISCRVSIPPGNQCTNLLQEGPAMVIGGWQFFPIPGCWGFALTSRFTRPARAISMSTFSVSPSSWVQIGAEGPSRE
jgi:hypothetical protein